MFGLFKKNKIIKDAAYLLFTEIVEQARKPYFYSQGKVADTLDGRFDLIILHLSLVINRLERGGDDRKIALLIRYIQEILFDNMDLSLREMGVGDMSVGKKVKVMAEAYYGRKAAYQDAIKSDNIADNLKITLVRNLYRGEAPDEKILSDMGAYILRQITCLESQSDESLLLGDIRFQDEC